MPRADGSDGGTKAILTALGANIGIAIAKFAGYLLTGSSSMLAESVHSVADSSNQALLLLGGRSAKRKASPVHQFGYGRVRYVAAFLVSIVLFSLALVPGGASPGLWVTRLVQFGIACIFAVGMMSLLFPRLRALDRNG